MYNPSNLGNLAFYDSLRSGLVPCKVTGFDGVTVYFTVTASKGAYKKGEELSAPSYHVIPRKMVHVRSGKYHFSPSYAWVNGVTVYAIATRH